MNQQYSAPLLAAVISTRRVLVVAFYKVIGLADSTVTGSLNRT